MARMLAEDVKDPRGIACITYNNECARELEQRLQTLGVEPGGRVFIGTVHSFSLTQIVLPYAKTARIGLPEDYRVATRTEQRNALDRAVERTVGGVSYKWEAPMGNYRRGILNRNSDAWRNNSPDLARLVEAYEAELRARRLIDFDDMPLLAVRALQANEWLRHAIFSKYPILIVDEYQDLGRALHRMVMGLCFRAGMRLFAVGDVDQSIYGFMGSCPELLQQLSEREDVETIRLRLNYRCGSRIVVASQYALGEDRGYESPEDAAEGTIFFRPCQGSYDAQADYLFESVLPDALERVPDVTLGQIAILYPSARRGDELAEAAQRHGFATIRTDKNALYPRSSPLLRWLELCAIWCCNGWRSGMPRLSKVINEGTRVFQDVVSTSEQKLVFQRGLLALLWARRDSTASLHDWLIDLHDGLLAELLAESRTLRDERDSLEAFIGRTSEDGDAQELTLGLFSGYGEGNDRINLSTLHSAKGREFAIVVLFAMDQGEIPWNNVSDEKVRESRRLFYVGFTRPEREVHIVYTEARPSPFVQEVQQRLLEGR
jgi:DNA helicase-2/ATP-dependent DNA helicase PcrA